MYHEVKSKRHKDTTSSLALDNLPRRKKPSIPESVAEELGRDITISPLYNTIAAPLEVLPIKNNKWNVTNYEKVKEVFKECEIIVNKTYLTHFILLVFFDTPRKQKTRGFLMFSWDIEKEQWHEMVNRN